MMPSMADKHWHQAVRAADTEDISRISQITEAAYDPYIARIGKRPAPMDADIPGGVERGEVFVIEDGGDLFLDLSRQSELLKMGLSGFILKRDWRLRNRRKK